MACFSPIDCWQLDSGKVVFTERPRDGVGLRRSLQLPCGQCIGCRLERSRQWAVRCMHENQMHVDSSFVTLTYDDEHLPPFGGLVHRDFQLFMKRLRKRTDKVRFFMCGEYGSLNLRPHFHACLFGAFFDDREHFSKSPSGSDIYTSKLLESLWPYGFCSVGDVTFESAAYVARYVMKKVTGDAAKSAYERINVETGEMVCVAPEYCRMSLRPGIGASWIRRFNRDVYPHDFVVVNGVKCKPPRYYDRFIKENCGTEFDDVEFDRYVKAEENSADCTDERLAVREEVTKARLAFKKRIL